MPSYRKIFPSFDWDEDVWRVNQIINLPIIIGKEQVGFVKNVPNEEVKKSNEAVRRWIDTNMDGCSCLILFIGEKTYQSPWVKYELELASQKGMGRINIYVEGMRNREGIPSLRGRDPYAYHGMYVPPDTPGAYVIKEYFWLRDNGQYNIGSWIEEACLRAGK